VTAGRWVVVSGDFTPLGGMDAANWALARYLATVGRVDVVTHRAWDDLAALPTATVHRVWRPLGKHLLGDPLLDRAGRAVAKRLAAEGARVVVNGGNCRWFDVTWVHYCHAAYAPAAPTGLVRGAKAVVHRRRAVARERQVLTAARAVVCNSRLTARHAVELVGVPEGRVRVVYYGCDPALFAPPSTSDRAAARRELGLGDRPWAVFVGALGDSRKGFDTLYTAWKGLCADRAWDANLAVVGRGADLPAWEARARADGLADRVRFLGFRPDVPRVLAGCDVMVHPARYEAYGLGVHEAVCRGLPAVVSAAAGVAERFPTELGDLLLGNPDDAGELADRLRGWRRDLDAWPARVAPVSAALRARTWDDMSAEFVSAVGGS
jgi:glycosyltransferase involved in cell wall biosynthesis